MQNSTTPVDARGCVDLWIPSERSSCERSRSTAPVSEAASSLSTPLYFPHVVDSGGYSTQFILFSGQPGPSLSGTFQLY